MAIKKSETYSKDKKKIHGSEETVARRKEERRKGISYMGIKKFKYAQL